MTILIPYEFVFPNWDESVYNKYHFFPFSANNCSSCQQIQFRFHLVFIYTHSFLAVQAFQQSSLSSKPGANENCDDKPKCLLLLSLKPSALREILACASFNLSLIGISIPPKFSWPFRRELHDQPRCQGFSCPSTSPIPFLPVNYSKGKALETRLLNNNLCNSYRLQLRMFIIKLQPGEKLEQLRNYEYK